MTITGPYVDESATYGPSGFASPSSITSAFLDGGVGFGPSMPVVNPSPVSVTVGGTEVTAAFDRNFRDQIADTGSFSFSVHEDDATGIDFDETVIFRVEGQPVFLGVVESLDRVKISSGERAGRVVQVSGRGGLSLLDQAVVYPSRGVESQPIEEVRSFSWVAPDFDDSAWPAAKNVNRQRAYTGTDGSPLPYIWPDTTAYWVWANLPSVTAIYAPPGVCLFRDTLTLADDEKVRIYSAFDLRGNLYIDGQEFVNAGSSSLTTGKYVEMDMTAGDHVIAARVINENRPGAPPLQNPGGFIWCAYSVTDSGLLGTLLGNADAANTKCLAYPATAPGFTHGEVLIKLLEEAQAQDFDPDITWDFTEELDSGGNAWGEYREVSVQVGRALSDVVREMSDAFIDVAMAPGSKTLRAWARGERGNTIAVTLAQTTDPTTSDFLELRHQGRRTRMNGALVRYADGHIEELDAASIAANNLRAEYLELGAVKGEAEARRIAAQLMDSRADASWATTGTLLPHNDAATPYLGGWAVADTIECPDEDDADAEMRVRSISMVEDSNGVITWGLELRDERYDEMERHEAWLRRMSAGNGLAGARVGSRAGTPAPAAQTITQLNVAEFSFDNVELVEGSSSPIRTAAVSGNIVEIAGQLTTPGTTTTYIDVYGGHTIVGGYVDDEWFETLEFPPGVTEAEVAMSIEPVKANYDKAQCTILTAGTGAAGLDVQVRAI